MVIATGLSAAAAGCRPAGTETATSGGRADSRPEKQRELSAGGSAHPGGVRADAGKGETSNAASVPPRIYTEVTADMGLPRAQPEWPPARYLTPEITPGGVALFDYDGDGDLDVYQICHGPPALPPRAFKLPAPNRLYRQDAGKLVEVAQAAGLNDPGYGHGAAVGDVDNDGDLDVYVTNYGPDRFYLNNGDGGFTNQTQAAGLASDSWSSAASFIDYNRDGLLDLFVVHFAQFDEGKRCQSNLDGDEPDYCGPHTFPGLRDTLFKNNGDGGFTDVSEQVGIAVPARGWGALCGDLTGDGWPDIYVANDEEPNQLWVGSADGTFFDEAVLRGLAFNGQGRVEASMGVTWGDLDDDQRLDLFMTHVTSETNTLFTSGGSFDGESYADRSIGAGMSSIDLPYTGWGCAMFDVDHDGDLDLAVANGRVAKGPVRPEAELGDCWNRYAEPNLLFLNDGNGRFQQPAEGQNDFSARLEVTRGLAVGDLDGDGDLDLVTNDIANVLRVYRNDAPPPDSHWLMIKAVTGGRDAVGARITLLLPGGKRRTAIVQPSYSYLASNDPRVHFGLGDVDQAEGLEVVWPDGAEEAFSVGGVDRLLTIRQGEGQAGAD